MVQSSPSNEPTGKQWEAFYDALLLCTNVCTPYFGHPGSTFPSISENKRIAALEKRWNEVKKQPAYRWLWSQPGTKDAFTAFENKVSKSFDDRVRFLTIVCKHLRWVKRGEPNPRSLPRSYPKRQEKAVRCARQLIQYFEDKAAGFQYQPDEATSHKLLLAFISLNSARRRKPREDDTFVHRRFVKDLTYSMFAQFGKAPLSVIKPWLELIEYDLDERGIKRLLAAARCDFNPGRYPKFDLNPRSKPHPNVVGARELAVMLSDPLLGIRRQ